MRERRAPKLPRAVTFDCWSTLIHEAGTSHGVSKRVGMIASAASVSEDRARAALGAAWRHHQIHWHRRVAFTAHDMAVSSLEALGVTLAPERLRELTTLLEDEALKSEIRAIPGAKSTLEKLAEAGVRRALICDTGFSPGRVVRALLARVGLLDLLEVTVFSDEVGVPKPHPLPFETALEGLSVSAGVAVHIGDLRRSDVAGARAAGMGTIRITAHHDDKETAGRGAGVIDCEAAGCDPVCERPEADSIAASYGDVDRLLGLD
ncbi:MAG TPA: HAD family hydrolase [Polyangiaceae bacterium]